jgi:hypothetical protein
MNMNNGAEDIPCETNEHVGSQGGRLSTHSKRHQFQETKIFYGKHETRCLPIAN